MNSFNLWVLPRAVEESPPLEGFRILVDVAPRDNIGIRVGVYDLRGLFQPKWFYDPCQGISTIQQNGLGEGRYFSPFLPSGKQREGQLKVCYGIAFTDYTTYWSTCFSMTFLWLLFPKTTSQLFQKLLLVSLISEAERILFSLSCMDIKLVLSVFFCVLKNS